MTAKQSSFFCCNFRYETPSLFSPPWTYAQAPLLLLLLGRASTESFGDAGATAGSPSAEGGGGGGGIPPYPTSGRSHYDYGFDGKKCETREGSSLDSYSKKNSCPSNFLADATDTRV